MKTRLPRSRRNRPGFTLIELLVVISIIAILAALLLPVLAAVKKHALMTKARLEVNDIATAIQGYDSAYGRFPVSTAAQTAAGNNAINARNPNGDFTYGGIFNGIRVFTPGYEVTNAEVIAILMDATSFPNGGPTVNANHAKNPQQQHFLNAKMSGWDPSQSGTPLAGVGNDLVYRDPWGNPYVISMDLNYDQMCQDEFYCQKVVSWQNGSQTAGLNGLVSAGNPVNPDDYRYRGTVMVWSAGPDGKIASGPANQGFNRDNILSWK